MWTIEDVERGLCSLDQVGLPKPIAQGADSSSPTIEDIDRAAILDGLLENSLTSKSQAEFNAWARANPGVYHPMLAKHNLAKNMKEPPAKLPDIEKIPDAELALMSSNDLKRIVLAAHGITKQSQLSDDL